MLLITCKVNNFPWINLLKTVEIPPNNPRDNSPADNLHIWMRAFILRVSFFFQTFQPIFPHPLSTRSPQLSTHFSTCRLLKIKLSQRSRRTQREVGIEAGVEENAENVLQYFLRSLCTLREK